MTKNVSKIMSIETLLVGFLVVGLVAGILSLNLRCLQRHMFNTTLDSFKFNLFRKLQLIQTVIYFVLCLWLR